MPSVLLTAKMVSALQSGTRRDLCDSLVPGLTLRCSATGAKTWSCIYRHQGRNRRLTLGRYPAVSLADARDLARDARARVRLGEDPAVDKQAQREQFRNTIGALVEAFELQARTLRSWPETRRILHREVLPAWRNRLVADITRRDVRELVAAKATTAPVMANRLLARLSRLFSFAIEQEWIEASPAYRIAKPTRERSRARTLTSNELNELWAALHGETSRLPTVQNDALIVTLLTAQRSGEVARMRWSDLDLETAWWTIPGTMTKNGQDHRVPLTETVLAILRRRNAPTNLPDSTFVFSTTPGTSIAARAKKVAAILSRHLSFAFTRHDLRRTAASGMAEAGIPRDHIAHTLNHRSVTHSTVTAIYDRYSYDREKRVALETWARVIARTCEQAMFADLVPFTRQSVP